VVPPDREQLALLAGDDVGGVGVANPTDDQPGADLPLLPAGCESGEWNLGDLGVGHPLVQFL